MLAAIRLARAQARDRAWMGRGELIGTELPGSRAAGKLLGQIVIDLDATLVAALSEQRLEFSVGYPDTDAVRDTIAQVPKWAWQVASNADGDLREHADVVEVTGLLDLNT